MKLKDEYFNSIESKYIYALIELDTQARANILGISIELYHDKEKAKKWFDNINSIIEPNKDKYSNGDKAIIKLNELYKNMIKN